MLLRNLVRSARYMYYTKVLRQAGDPEYIARGVAIGLLIGWVVPIGFQLLIAVPLAFVLKAAKIPAVVFTFVSNHFTVFFLYPLQCWLGGLALGYNFDYNGLSKDIACIANAQTIQASWEQFWQLGKELACSFVAGGLILGVPSAVFGYYMTVYLVKRYRRFREERRKKNEETAKTGE